MSPVVEFDEYKTIMDEKIKHVRISMHQLIKFCNNLARSVVSQSRPCESVSVIIAVRVTGCYENYGDYGDCGYWGTGVYSCLREARLVRRCERVAVLEETEMRAQSAELLTQSVLIGHWSPHSTTVR